MISVFNGVMTALLIVVFLGVWAWAWSPKNKESFKQMANLPLDDQPSENRENNRESNNE